MFPDKPWNFDELKEECLDYYGITAN